MNIAQANFFVVKHKPGIQCYRACLMAKNMLYTHRNVAKDKQCFLTAVIQGIWKQFLCPLLPVQKDTGALQSFLTLYGLSEEVISEEMP